MDILRTAVLKINKLIEEFKNAIAELLWRIHVSLINVTLKQLKRQIVIKKTKIKISVNQTKPRTFLIKSCQWKAWMNIINSFIIINNIYKFFHFIIIFKGKHYWNNKIW